MRWCYVSTLTAALAGSGWGLAQTLPPVSADPVAPAKPAPPLGAQGTTPAQSIPGMPPGSPGPNLFPEPPVGAPRPGYENVLSPGQLDNWALPCRIYGSADYILWRINTGQLPQVSSTPPVGVVTVVSHDYAEILNTDGTVGKTFLQNQYTEYFPFQVASVPAIPNGAMNTGDHNGVRATVGFWLDPEQSFGLEASFFYLQQRGGGFNNYAINNNAQTVITTPFNDRLYQIIPGTPGSLEVPATPPTETLIQTLPIVFVREADNNVAGFVSNSLWGAELNARCLGVNFGPVAITSLVGFRYQEYHEDLDVEGFFSMYRPANVPGTDPLGSSLDQNLTIQTHDSVRAHDYFYGGQAGLDFSGACGRFYGQLTTKLALGDMHQVADVNSSTVQTTTTSSGATTTTSMPGGLLFTPLNNSRYTNDKISVIPDLNLRVGYFITHWLVGYIGYDVMYISSVARTGDLSVPAMTTTSVTAASSPSQVPVQQSAFHFGDSHLWTQGLTFGLELRY